MELSHRLAIRAELAAGRYSLRPFLKSDLIENIFHSHTFGSRQLFHVFVDAIFYGLLGAYLSPVLPFLKTDCRVSGQVALKLTSIGFERVLIDATVTGPLPSRKKGTSRMCCKMGSA
ncbi:hypothetical protein IV203_025628 [Nitzschia inconspicua]|uniref:Uncharacterized protein n=1 Tax=Nitzschia inconspicua TaxID=303405 RepID=A0A9K3PW50_9STRA|nr:hypothetical protein IV203_025628 [Nitzschia inconspicua]